MSSLINDPDISQESVSTALVPDKQKRQLESPKLTPIQQKKTDALELAELIYKIYNKNCPIVSNRSAEKENENV